MTDRAEATYYVIRYMLDELRDEAANVGVILLTRDPVRIIPRFLEDPSTKSRPDARVDSQSVEDFREWVEDWELRATDAAVAERGGLNVFEAALRERSGNTVRLSGPRTVFLTHPNTEADRLFEEWVAVRARGRSGRPLQPRDPLSGIRTEAQIMLRRTLREGIRTPAIRRLLQPNYQVPGRVHLNKFDAAFVPKEKRARVQIFHHVLVLPDPEDTYDQAAALARRWIDVRDVGNHKQLTAVLYSRENPTQVKAPDATELLKHDHIEVVNVAKLRSVATRLEPQTELLTQTRGQRRKHR